MPTTETHLLRLGRLLPCKASGSFRDTPRAVRYKRAPALVDTVSYAKAEPLPKPTSVAAESKARGAYLGPGPPITPDRSASAHI